MSVEQYNPESLRGTRAAKYFIERYGAATIEGAVERAIQSLREPCLPYLDPAPETPVDVDRIAVNRGIRIRMDLKNGQDGKLEVTPSGFVVRLSPAASRGRRRYSLAHELGHTLFYVEQQHQIASLARNEVQAEEIICNQVASALLMPKQAIREQIDSIEATDPWSVLSSLERVANRLAVSLPALVTRLRTIRTRCNPCLVVLLHIRKNRRTHTDPQPRLWTWCVLGDTEHIWIPPNRTARGLELHVARALFDAWTRLESRDSAGRYVLDDRMVLRRASRDHLQSSTQRINVARCDARGWRQITLETEATQCLYVPPRANDRNVYALSVHDISARK